MARAFDRASTQYLEIDPWSGFDQPLTMACWFYSGYVAANQWLLNVFLDWSNYYSLWLAASGAAPQSVRGQIRDAVAGEVNFATTANWTVNTWQHAAVVFSSNVSRAVYLSGSNKGTDVTDCTPSTCDELYIGCRGAGNSPTDGSIAEAAWWNVALTDDEVAVLADGYSPLLVRPQNLVHYWPLVRDNDEDLVGGASLTPVAGPTVVEHTRVLYAVGSFAPIPSAIAAILGERGILRGVGRGVGRGL